MSIRLKHQLIWGVSLSYKQKSVEQIVVGVAAFFDKITKQITCHIWCLKINWKRDSSRHASMNNTEWQETATFIQDIFFFKNPIGGCDTFTTVTQQLLLD